jgi:hypothetical protein
MLEGDPVLRGYLRSDVEHSQYEYVSRAQRFAARVEFVAREIELCAQELQATMGEALAKYETGGVVAAVEEDDAIAAAIESCLGPTISRAAKELLSVEAVSGVSWNTNASFEVRMQRRGGGAEWMVGRDGDYPMRDHLIFHRVCVRTRVAIRIPCRESKGSTVEVGFGRLPESFQHERWFAVNRTTRTEE